MPLTIDRLSRSGLGVAGDGTHVPRVLPGEVVEPAEPRARVLTPSPDRVAAPCRHYRACGGCALQHASDRFVSGWKARVVEAALAAQGIAASVEAVHTSPPNSRRRAKLSGRRTRAGATVGLHAPASDRIVEVPGCLVLDPAIVAALPALGDLTTLAATRKGEVGLHVTTGPAGLDVDVQAGRARGREMDAPLAAFAQAHDLARLSWDAEPVVTRRPPAQGMGRARVVPPPGAFLQATAEGQDALVGFVAEALEGAGQVIDLFAGCGTFALPLAERAEVLAVEGDAAMLTALDAGWRGAPGLRRVRTQARDLFRDPLEVDELRADAVVLDPPRAGARAQVVRLAASAVGRIAYVSCDAASFARDAAALTAGGYGLRRLEVVDQFRWSAHVEIASLWARD
ncbi:MAG: class I SAM-dependent RNA methyltransferase [Paracoccaceae bacterium]